MKQKIITTTLAASLMLTPTVLSHSNISHAAENESQTKDLDSGKKINTKDILKKEDNKTIKPLDNKPESIAKNQAGEESEANTYNKPFSYNNGVYEFGQGAESSGAFKALDLEAKISDSDISMKKKDVSDHDKSSLANITVPGQDADTIGTGSATAIGKHTLITNNHVVRKSAEEGMTPHDLKDINIYPNRDGDNIPYKLKPTKIDMLKSGDLAVIHVDEDLSKYMKINKIADEKTIEDMKENDDITIDGYPAGHKHDTVSKSNDYPHGTPFESNGKFLMNATNIHPIMYYKSYTESGMSGSSVTDKDGNLIGIHAGILDQNNGNDGDTSYGFTITKELRKDILKVAPEVGEDTNTDNDNNANKEEPSKADDTKSDDTDTSNTDNNTSDNNTSDDTKSDNNTSDNTSDSDAKSDNSTTNDSNSNSDEDQPSTDSNDNTSSDNNTTSSSDNNESNNTENTSTTTTTPSQTTDDKSTDSNTNSEQPTASDNTQNIKSNNNEKQLNTNTSMGQTDKQKEKKVVAKNHKSDDKNKDKKDKASSNDKSEDKKSTNNDKQSKSNKDKDKKNEAVAASSTPDKSKDNNKSTDHKTTNDSKFNNDNDDASNTPSSKPEANNTTNDQSPASNTNSDNTQKPDKEEPQDHQTFAGLPDTGSTAGNVTELLAVISATIGFGILAAQQMKRFRNNHLNKHQ